MKAAPFETVHLTEMGVIMIKYRHIREMSLVSAAWKPDMEKESAK